ncbi:WG repeat-containing protein [Sphingobacterium spiritivorum]|uniref:WG repeat-containing protein n=1 Tax=Sphingobacterium spiritivorum TaxID=258 RepID=UPI003DA1FF56
MRSIRTLLILITVFMQVYVNAQTEPVLVPVNDRKQGYIGYYLEDGTEVVPPQFCTATYLIEDKYYIVSRAEHDHYPDGRRKEEHIPGTEKYGLLNSKGKVIIPLDDNYSFITVNNGVITVGKNDTYGVVDEENKITVPLIYASLDPIDANLIVAERNNKAGIIDIHNNVKVAFEFDRIYPFEKGSDGSLLAMVEIAHKTAVINPMGKYILQPSDMSVSYLTPVSFVIKEGEHYGLMDYDQKVLVPAMYTDAYKTENELQFRKDDHYYYFSFGGKLIRKEKIEESYKSVD